MELLKKSLMPNSPHLPHLICAKNAVKNDLAVDSDNLKALKSFGLGWLIRKDLDRKNFKPFLNHLPLSFLFIVHMYCFRQGLL